MRFGQSAEEYQETRGDETGEVWIRRFKDASTRIRIVPYTAVNSRGEEKTGTAAWPTEREHYESGIGYFPHNRFSPGDCVGCNDPDPKVKKMQRKYYFPALDERGELRIFKMGSKLYEVMQGREQRIGTLSDRDYIINKMGKDLGTTYDPEPGEKYEVDFPSQDEIPDIPQILTDLYLKAVAAYNGDDPDVDANEPQDTPAAQPTSTRIQRPAADTPAETSNRIQRPAAKKAEAPAAKEEEAAPESPAAEPSEPGEAEWKSWGPTPDDSVFAEAETSDIKAWLTSKEVEFPSRAPRARIIEMAKKAAIPF